MAKFLAAIVLISACFSIASSAIAAGGCGVGWHRGPRGGCRPNEGPPAVVVAGPRGVIYAPLGRACPYGYHLGPHGQRCWPN